MADGAERRVISGARLAGGDQLAGLRVEELESDPIAQLAELCSS